MPKDKFMFFPNFKAMADKLDGGMRLKFYDALTNYVFHDIQPDDPIISALLEAIKPSLDKVDGRQNNGGNHNPNGVNQHSKIGQSGQIRSKLVNSGQFLSETETETEAETETKEKEISNDISKKNPIDFDTPFQAGGQLWELPAQFRKLALTKYTESEIRAFEMKHSCHENPEDVCLNDIEHESKKPEKKSYGEQQKVKLTDEEYAKLQDLYGNKLNKAIEKLDVYLASYNKKYASHYAVMRRGNWVYKEIFKDGNEQVVPDEPIPYEELIAQRGIKC